MNIKIFTLFPELIKNYFNESLLQKSLLNKIWEVDIINIRDYSFLKHNNVDDTSYGGGHGMVLRPDIIADAIDKNCDVEKTKFIYMSPRGKQLNQEKIRELLTFDNISILCGRYEGVDERVIEEYEMEEISIGDFVLLGGELPALTLTESLVRCLEGVLGDKNSLEEDSFGGLGGGKFDYLLEYPLYTRPEKWRERAIPEILKSGHHKNIENWKLLRSEEVTKNKRKDLWEKYLKVNGKNNE